MIAALVLLPGRNMPSLGREIISIDKAIHASLFAGLIFLMIVGFTKQSAYPSLRNKALRYSLIISATYAIAIEGAQLLSAERSFELADMAANLIGCFAGILVFFAIYRW